METQSVDTHKQNVGLEFNTHVCLQCKSCVEGLDQYVSHIKNGCFTAEEEEQNILEDFKKKEHQLKKELSALRITVVEKEGQLKDIQNKILRHERTGHKVKTAQLKIKAEEVAISKKEMKQLKLKYNKLLCYLKEHEHEIDQTEKKGDTPEKIHYQKSPKKVSSSKITTVKFSDRYRSPEKRREIAKEKTRLIIQDSLFKKSKKDKKELTNVNDSGRHLLEDPSKDPLSKLSCSETVSTNLKESSVVGINPKHSKTNKNESIKDDKFSFTNKIKQESHKPEKLPNLEPISESSKFLDSQGEISPVSLLMNFTKQNIASKAKNSLDLYRKTDISFEDTTNEAQSPCYKSVEDGIKINQEKKSEKPLQPILKNTKSVHSNSEQSTIEFVNSQQSITIVDKKVDDGKPMANLGKPIKPILKSKITLSKDSECPKSVNKVENVKHRSPISFKNSKSNNDSVVFLRQIQLPPNNEIRVVPLVSTPICKEEKLDFVDPDLSAIISGEEVSNGLDESVYLLSKDSSEDPKESEAQTQLDKKIPEAQKEFEGFTSTKNKEIITERIKDKVKFKNVSFEQKLKDQAKDESHNEAMILETDLDNEEIKKDSDQCIDDTGNVSIYSPQDTVETLSLSGSEFLTVSEATKSPIKADVSSNCDSKIRIDFDKNVDNNSNNDSLSKSDKSREAESSEKDDKSNSGKSSEFTPSFENTQGLQKESVNVDKRTDTLDDSDKVEKLTTLVSKSDTAKHSEITLSKGSSGSQRQKITLENMGDKVEKSDNIEKLPTATVKPLNTASTKLSKDEASRRDKRKLHPEGLGSTEKRTRINSANANDGVWNPPNHRRGGTNSAMYQGDRFRPSYDPNHHPRPGVLRVPYQRPSRPPWHPRGTNNYRPRMHNQNHYNWNYRW